MQRTLDVHFDELVIGADLSALSYAYNKRLPVVFTRLLRPCLYGIELNNKVIEKYNNLLFNLAYSSLIPFSNLIQNLRLENENTLKATTVSNIVINITFNRLNISDDYNLAGLLPPTSKTSCLNTVVDTFYIKGGRNNNNLSLLNFDDNLIKTLHIFRKKTTGIAPYGCASVSLIYDNDLEKFEYSQSYIRINLNIILKDNNFNGKWYKTNTHFKIFNLLSEERLIFPIGKNLYDNTSNINFLYNVEETNVIPITKETRINV